MGLALPVVILGYLLSAICYYTGGVHPGGTGYDPGAGLRCEIMKTRETVRSQRRVSDEDEIRGRTRVEGQNPKADDAVDKDLYHDDNRRNLYDPEVARSLWKPDRKSETGSSHGKSHRRSH